MPIVSFLASFSITAALIPAILHFAHRNRLYDKVDARKIHNGNIPRLGGVGIFVSFFAVLAILRAVRAFTGESAEERFLLWPVAIGGISMFTLGLVDDLRDLKARFKLVIELLASVLIISLGFRFRIIMVPWGDGLLELGLLSYPITLAWILGITNAVNLVDGLDGLAGGISCIIAVTFGIFFWTNHLPISAETCLALAGAVGGFLIFNLPNAKIFMGDSGSLFLGFCLAVLPLLGQRDNGAEIGLISAATVLSIPIFDTLFAMLRRTKAGVSFFTADRGHLHHMLLDRLKDVKRVLAVIYGVNMLLAAASLSTLYLDRTTSFILKVASLAAMPLFFRLVHARAKKPEL